MSEIARRRIAALLLVAGVAVAALAIADVGPFDDPPTPEEEVSGTVSDFYGAAADGDFVAFCGLLTEQARAQLRGNASQLLGKEQSCADALDSGLGEGLQGGCRARRSRSPKSASAVRRRGSRLDSSRRTSRFSCGRCCCARPRATGWSRTRASA